jgi:hypothetical protein
VVRVLHLESRAVTRLLHDACDGNAIALVQLPRDEGLVEPDDLQTCARVVAQSRFGELHPLT